MSDALALVIEDGQVGQIGYVAATDSLLVKPGTAAGLDVDAAGILGLGTGTPTATSVEIGTGGSGIPVTIGAGGAGGSMTTIAGDMTVSGNEIVVGTTTFQGNTQIGNATSDTLEVQATVINSTAGGVPANTSLFFDASTDHVLTIGTANTETAGTSMMPTGGDGGASGGAAAGGAGGGFTGTAGDGGAGNTTFAGGDGGPAALLGGTGGAGPASALSGAGGDITITGGDAGSDGGGGRDAGGSVFIDAGVGGTNGTVDIGTTNASAINIGNVGSGICATLTHAEVSGSGGNACVTLNATTGAAAGAYAIGTQGGFTNFTPTDDSVAGALDGIDTALAGGGGTLQSAYDNGSTITEDNTEQNVTIARGTNATNEVLALTDTTSAVAQSVLTIDKSPTASAAGDALNITMGGNATGRAIDAGGDVIIRGDTEIGDATTDTLDILAEIVNNGQPNNESLRFSTGGTHLVFIPQSAATTIGGQLTIESGEGGDSNGASGGNGGQFNITAGAGGAGSATQVGGQGGPLFIRAGASGADNGAGTQAAGNLTIEAGDSTADGGDVFIRGGDSSGGTAGDVNVLGGDGVVDGFVRVGTSQTNAVFVGSPTTANDIPATVSHAEVAGSAGNASVTLNLTGAATAGSYAIGCYDDPAWVNINPSNDSLQGMLDAIDAALSAGTDTWQSVVEGSSAGTTNIGDVDSTTGPMTLRNNTDATDLLALTHAFAGGGSLIDGTMGATTTDDAISILMTTGATGAALFAGDGTESIRYGLSGITSSQGTTYATDDNAAGDGSTGFQITTQTGAGADGTGATPGGTGGNINEVVGAGGAGTGTAGGFGGNGGQYISTAGTGGAGGGVGSGSGGVSTIAGGNGAAADATFAGSGGGQISRGGVGGAATGAVSGGAGGTHTGQGGTGGAGSATGTAGAGGDAMQVGGSAGADGGGGGANGGDAISRGGAGTGAGTDGLVILGDQNTSGVEVGASGNGITLDITSTETTPTSRSRAQALSLNTTVGTVQADIGIFVTDGNPNTDADLSAQSGSIALDDTGAVWVNTSGGGVGTTWSMLASGAGNNLQQAYDAGPDISQDASGGIEVSKNDASGNTEYVLRLDDVDDAAATNTMEINKSPAVASTGGHALAITVGANSTGDGVNIVDAGTGPAIFVNKTGAGGSALQIQDGGGDVLVISNTGNVAVTPTSGTDFTVDVAGAGTISLDVAAASNFTVSGATADLTLGARGSTITLNESGDESLDSSFTATSIVGALNELIGGFAGTTQYAGTVNGTTSINAGEVVALMDDTGSVPRVFPADADAGDQTENAIGIALAAATTGNPIQVVVAGEVPTPDAAWTGGVPGTTNVGDPVFVSTSAGLLTLTAPGGASRVLKIGVVSFGGTGAVRVMVNAPDSIKL